MGPSILAIDDSEVALEIIEVSLAEFGFDRITTYNDPRRALEALSAAEVSPDLILLDVMMPHIDGVEMCARIRVNEASSEVPIIMLTSRSDMATLNHAFMAGANDYVTKPFDRVELESRIRNCLRLKSEFDRRKSSERRLASNTALPGQGERRQGPIDPRIILTPGALDAALVALPQTTWARLGLIAMRLERAAAQDSRGPLSMPLELGRILAEVELPANSLFSPYGEGVHLCATLGLDPPKLDAVAARFAEAVAAAGLIDKRDPARKPLVLKTSVTTAEAAPSLAAAVAEALHGLDRARPVH